MRFTLRQLSYFVAAGEHLSVTCAAERLNISQPSISAAIAHLESELDVQLFVRHHARGLTLTDAGTRLLRTAQDAVRAAGAMNEVARDVRDRVEGALHVGTFFSLAPLMAPELWIEFSRRYDRVRMAMTEGSAPALIEDLRQSRIDVALTWDMDIPADVAFSAIVRLRNYVLVPASHRFAARGSVRLAEMLDDPFVLVDLPGTKEYYLGLFESIGAVPQIVTRTGSTASLRSYVAAGIGYGVMTSRPINQVAENGLPLAYLTLEDVTRDIAFGIAHLTSRRPSRAMDAFADHCREAIGRGRIPGTSPEAADRLDNP